MRRLVFAAIPALLVLAGCSTSSDPLQSPATATSTATVAPLPTPTLYAGALDDLLIPMPGGAQQFIISNFAAGDPDIVKASKMWNAKDHENIASLFKKSGFQRGTIRAWQDAAGNIVVVNLVQFRDDTGVNDWVFWAAAGLTAGNTAGSGHIPEANNGKWAELIYGDLHHLTLIYFRGQIGVILYVDSPGAGNVELLKALAVDQYNRLPKP